MKLICCLGNPGPSYTHTRHNIGFRVGEALLNAHPNFEKMPSKFNSILYKGLIGSTQVILQFPQTFMNLSGNAFQPLTHYYKTPLEDTLVIYDDFDIPFTTLRLKPSGSAGTHNGMKSILATLATPLIPRLRIGIGPLPSGQKVVDFVLSNFNQDEEIVLPTLLSKATDAIQIWVNTEINLAMKQIN